MKKIILLILLLGINVHALSMIEEKHDFITVLPDIEFCINRTVLKSDVVLYPLVDTKNIKLTRSYFKDSKELSLGKITQSIDNIKSKESISTSKLTLDNTGVLIMCFRSVEDGKISFLAYDGIKYEQENSTWVNLSYSKKADIINDSSIFIGVLNGSGGCNGSYYFVSNNVSSVNISMYYNSCSDFVLYDEDYNQMPYESENGVINNSISHLYTNAWFAYHFGNNNSVNDRMIYNSVTDIWDSELYGTSFKQNGMYGQGINMTGGGGIGVKTNETEYSISNIGFFGCIRPYLDTQWCSGTGNFIHGILNTQNFDIVLYSDLRYYFEFGGDYSGELTYSTLDNTKYYCFAYTCDGIYCNGYVNGELKTTFAHSYSKPISAKNIKIGYRATLNQFISNVVVDELFLYDKNLTQTDVTQLYNNFKGNSEYKIYGEEIKGDFSVVLNDDNESVSYFQTPTINFTVSGNKDTYECELMINNTSSGINTTVQNNTTTGIIVNYTLSPKTYTYFMNCSNNAYYNSSVYSINITEHEKTNQSIIMNRPSKRINTNISSTSYTLVSSYSIITNYSSNTFLVGSGYAYKQTGVSDTYLYMKITINDFDIFDDSLLYFNNNNVYKVINVPRNLSSFVNGSVYNIKVYLKSDTGNRIGIRDFAVGILTTLYTNNQNYSYGQNTTEYKITGSDYNTVLTEYYNVSNSDCFVSFNGRINSSGSTIVNAYIINNKTGESSIINTRNLINDEDKSMISGSTIFRNLNNGTFSLMINSTTGEDVTYNGDILYLSLNSSDVNIGNGNYSILSTTGIIINTSDSILHDENYKVKDINSNGIYIDGIINAYRVSLSPILNFSISLLDENKTYDDKEILRSMSNTNMNSNPKIIMFATDDTSLYNKDLILRTRIYNTGSGESRISSYSISYFEAYSENWTYIDIPPILEILTPVNESQILGNFSVTWDIINQEDCTIEFDLINSTGYLYNYSGMNCSNLSYTLDTLLYSYDNYTINITGCDDSGCGGDIVNVEFVASTTTTTTTTTTTILITTTTITTTSTIEISTTSTIGNRYKISVEDYTFKSYLRCCLGTECYDIPNKNNTYINDSFICYDVEGTSGLNAQDFFFANVVPIGIILILLILVMYVIWKRR